VLLPLIRVCGANHHLGWQSRVGRRNAVLARTSHNLSRDGKVRRGEPSRRS